MFRPSRLKIGMFRPCSTKTNVLDRARPKQDKFRPLPTEKKCPTVLYKSKICFDHARLSNNMNYPNLKNRIYDFRVIFHDAFSSDSIDWSNLQLENFYR